MKKINFILLMSVVAMVLLCPQFSNAQNGRKKPKTTTGKVVTKPKITKPTKTETNREPTEAEMKEALVKGMVARGGERKSVDSVVINNAFAGSLIKIEQFEKLGCKPSTYGVGYFCAYKVTVSMKVYSNDGTSAGERQAEVWNKIIPSYQTATATKRFMRSKDGWIVADE